MPDIDVFLNVIGTGFMYKGKRAKLEKLFNIITKSSEKYPKAAVINCSLEPFDGKIEEYFAKLDLNKYDLITCRDKLSHEYLKRYGAEVHSDLVFAGVSENSERRGNILGLAPVRRLYDSGNYSYYKELAAYADYYVENYGGRVLVFAFDSGLENDISAALSVQKMMKNREHSEIVMYNSDPREFEARLGECTHFAGSRFHSIVVSYAHGIKTAGIYDRKKLELLCGELGIPSVSKSEFTAERLIEITETSTFPERQQSVLADAYGHIRCLERFLNEKR